MDTYALYHHGTKGMRWGVRRYQNKDGSLTPAGRKRYADDGADATPRKKTLNEMSDDEIASAIRRKQLENQYNAMFPREVSAGRKFANKVMNDVIVPSATRAAKNYLDGALDKFGKDVLGFKTPEKLSWDDKLKKQDYERKEKQKVYDDLKRNFDTDKLRKDYDAWKKSNEESKNNTNSGKSKDTDNDTDSRTERSGKDWIDAEWRDLGTTNSTSSSVRDSGESYVLELLDYKRDDD